MLEKSPALVFYDKAYHQLELKRDICVELHVKDEQIINNLYLFLY